MRTRRTRTDATISTISSRPRSRTRANPLQRGTDQGAVTPSQSGGSRRRTHDRQFRSETAGCWRCRGTDVRAGSVKCRGCAVCERHFRSQAASNVAQGGRVQSSKVARDSEDCRLRACAIFADPCNLRQQRWSNFSTPQEQAVGLVAEQRFLRVRWNAWGFGRMSMVAGLFSVQYRPTDKRNGWLGVRTSSAID
jgi:hypothetical protein